MSRSVEIDAPPARSSDSRRGGGSAASTATRWLSLAAAPVFLGMALLTGLSHGSAISMLCATGHGASPLTGMTVMYLLMAVVHVGPWLRLILGVRGS